MNGIPAPGSLAQKGLLGSLISWLGTWSDESGSSPADLPSDTRVPLSPAYGSARVLVVDDNPVNLMVISALLESRGLMPFLAADGAEAVALASEHHFDLILMDLQMPILDGLEATSASGASRANVRGSRSLSSPTPARRLAPRSWRRAA